MDSWKFHIIYDALKYTILYTEMWRPQKTHEMFLQLNSG